MRRRVFLLAVTLVLAPTPSAETFSSMQTQKVIELKTDRPGGDYGDPVNIPDGRAESCQALCEKDAKCKSWTFANPKCYLKYIVSKPVSADCCVSGVSSRVPDFRTNTNRQGSDYSAIDVPDGRPETCQAACEQDERCKAWTFLKPDRCYLKDPVPVETIANCCISGVSSRTAALVSIIEITKETDRFAIRLRNDGDVESFAAKGQGLCRIQCHALDNGLHIPFSGGLVQPGEEIVLHTLDLGNYPRCGGYAEVTCRVDYRIRPGSDEWKPAELKVTIHR